MINYVKIALNVAEEDYEKAYYVLTDYDFCGIEEGFDLLSITFTEEYFTEELKTQLLDELSKFIEDYKVKGIEIIEDKNWNEEWEKNLVPFKVNDRIAITPSARANEIDAPIKLLINPKMSFGTGEHATTRLVATLMDGLVKKDSFWVDAGTGTGVLGILAVKLGAKSCYAFDNDPWSVENSIENAEMNGVADKMDIEIGNIDTMEIPSADGIAANLFYHLVKAALPKFRKALEISKGDLLISGIMVHDAKSIIETAEGLGFKLQNSMTENEWIAFHFK
jgi:ribosomal protein L11 methyltransferase